MLGLFKKKKLHSKVLVLCAVPSTENQFLKLFEDGHSDFVKSLIKQYGTSVPESLWSSYKKTAEQLSEVLQKAVKVGADVEDFNNLDQLKDLAGYDVRIIIAHHSANSNDIEIGGKLVGMKSFISSFPIGLNGCVDLTSCFSTAVLPILKIKSPNCRFIGTNVATSLPFRILILDEVLDCLCKKSSQGYFSDLAAVLEQVKAAMSYDTLNLTTSDSIKLGAEDLQSSVYAPARVCKGDDFFVQVFLHKEEDKGSVEIIAREVDTDASLRNQKLLTFEIKNGDKVDFQLVQTPNSTDDFVVEEDIKGFRWDGNPQSVEFAVSVSPQCKKNAFLGKLKIAVNDQMTGSMSFKTMISQYAESQCASFEFEAIDKDSLAASAQRELLQHLVSHFNYLRKEGSDRDCKICEKCIDLIKSGIHEKNPVLKVFVSSTSDMAQFRDAIKHQIDRCSMLADMYELWGQGNEYPRDVCCRHVLGSDIFVCILGGNYGFIEPCWGLSMTEIEYRTAVQAKIPTLVFILENWRDEISALKDNPSKSSSAEAQEALINELQKNRMVKFFDNELNLSLLASTSLLTLKYELTNERNKTSL